MLHRLAGCGMYVGKSLLQFSIRAIANAAHSIAPVDLPETGDGRTFGRPKRDWSNGAKE